MNTAAWQGHGPSLDGADLRPRSDVTSAGAWYDQPGGGWRVRCLTLMTEEARPCAHGAAGCGSTAIS
jgi:hypothetical protein